MKAFFFILDAHLKFLGSSWVEGLKMLFVPRTLWLFVQATANICLRTYKNMWPLIGVYGIRFFPDGLIIVWIATALCFIAMVLSPGIFLPLPFLMLLLMLLGWCYQTVCIFLAARPSIQIKDRSYFRSYWRHCFLFIILDLLCWRLSMLMKILVIILASPDALNFKVSQLKFLAFFLSLLTVGPIFLLGSLVTLFWLDVHFSVKNIFLSLWRAVKMFYYNAPLLLILFAWQLLIAVVYSIIFYGLIHSSMQFLARLMIVKTLLAIVVFLMGPALFIPLLIAPFVVVYVKKVNEQRGLYF